MKYLVNLDMSQNEIQNAVLQPLATAPTGKLGQIYYNSSDHKLYQHNGTTWVCVGVTYDISFGNVSNNTIPLTLTGSDGTTDTVNIAGSGGATLSYSNNTLTINASSTNTTYTFSGAQDGTNGYKITITPSTGNVQTVTIPMASGSAAGLMSSSDYTKLSGIETGAEVNVQADWDESSSSSDAYINNKPTIPQAGTNTNYPAMDGTKDLGSNSDYARVDHVHPTDTSRAPLASPALTGTPTAPTAAHGTDTTQIATTAFVNTAVSEGIAASDAMRFKGTIGVNGDVSSLPTTGVLVGDTYRVITAGTYAGHACEIGDLIIAIDTTPEWTVAQTNIDGAITSITGTSPITVSGSGASRAVSLDDSGVTAGTAIPWYDTKSGYYYFPALTIDSKGRITNRTLSDFYMPLVSATQAGTLSSARYEHLLRAYNGISDMATTQITITDGEIPDDSYDITLNYSYGESISGYTKVLVVDSMKAYAQSSNNLEEILVDWEVAGTRYGGYGGGLYISNVTVTASTNAHTDINIGKLVFTVSYHREYFYSAM